MRCPRCVAFFTAAILVSVLLVGVPRAHAANILFVADASSDTGIASALTMDGHTVTVRTLDLGPTGTNASFTADLTEYDAIFWSGGGTFTNHTNATVFANLTLYVANGGRVMYVGHDATLFDPMLLAFLGAGSSTNAFATIPGPIAAVESTLTTGVVDIRGLVPSTGSTDKDCLRSLVAGVTLITPAATDATCGLWTLRRVGDGEIAWVSNGEFVGSHPSWETRSTTATGAFNAAIRNFAAAADTVTREPGAPLISFDDFYSMQEGEALTLTVTVEDEEGDPFTFSWDLDDDGTFDELPGMASYTIEAGTTDGDDTRRLTVRASDGTHTAERQRTIRIRNAAPVITSTPPTMTSVGANIEYALAIEDPGGALDPLTFTAAEGPSGAAVTAEGVWIWSPTELDITLPGETIAVRVQVDDGDGGTTEQAWEIAVSPNRVPDGLTLIYPTNGIVIATPAPRLVVGNGVDPDVTDTLTYFVEIDDDAAFEPPHIATSGAITQGVGFTAFQLDAPLPSGIYHWRAWMSDGSAETTPVATSFQVVPDPRIDGGPVASPDGGTTAPDGGPSEMEEPVNCGCRTPGRQAGATLPGLFIAIGLALVIARRRRRD